MMPRTVSRLVLTAALVATALNGAGCAYFHCYTRCPTESAWTYQVTLFDRPNVTILDNLRHCSLLGRPVPCCDQPPAAPVPPAAAPASSSPVPAPAPAPT